ncbi:unnamed protein product [Protopolystoma xenopodis]|uniref:LIM zinc-binding domain-containing protein n=1 Tax=Protopolystoma xenopodis TaxID=117903 RepID=A0A3S5BE22_9PLAT|nr:unnamed protein product [Protopolystoma xenopodis]
MLASLSVTRAELPSSRLDMAAALTADSPALFSAAFVCLGRSTGTSGGHGSSSSSSSSSSSNSSSNSSCSSSLLSSPAGSNELAAPCALFSSQTNCGVWPFPPALGRPDTGGMATVEMRAGPVVGLSGLLRQTASIAAAAADTAAPVPAPATSTAAAASSAGGGITTSNNVHSLSSRLSNASVLPPGNELALCYADYAPLGAAGAVCFGGLPMLTTTTTSSTTPAGLLLVCAGCRSVICDQFYESVAGQAWHPGCLRCAGCGGRLQGRCYARSGQLFCREDFVR